MTDRIRLLNTIHMAAEAAADGNRDAEARRLLLDAAGQIEAKGMKLTPSPTTERVVL
jgi:hypothetical protein